jgi:hypothetical protein
MADLDICSHDAPGQEQNALCIRCGKILGKLPQTPISTEFDWRDIPVYILNRNNLDRGFRDLVSWLSATGTRYIEVLDNDSSYPPLLQYYNVCPATKITMLKENLGPYVFWSSQRHLQTETPYVITDPDVVPDKECPHDLIKKMLDVFMRYSPTCLKVGPGLRIDNLPNNYSRKNEVIAHEKQFYAELMPEKDVYKAAIDTTFAMYWTRQDNSAWYNHYRLAPPYVVEHRPWYINSAQRTDEDEFYAARCEAWSYWRR